MPFGENPKQLFDPKSLTFEVLELGWLLAGCWLVAGWAGWAGWAAWLATWLAVGWAGWDCWQLAVHCRLAVRRRLIDWLIGGCSHTLDNRRGCLMTGSVF